MSKKNRFRRLFDKQHVKRSQTLLIFAQQHVYHIYWPLRKKLSWKKSLLVIFKILGLSVNALIVDDKYCLLNKDNLTQPIQMKNIKENLLWISVYVFKIYIKFLTFWKKRMTLKVYAFAKVRTAKDVVR